MRDTLEKFETARSAKAEALLSLGKTTSQKIKAKAFPKGDPFPVARTAAILAAKKTSELIPYCHPIPIDWVDVHFEERGEKVAVIVEVKAIAKTGVEMEALTAASVAALTIYDMLKPLGEAMSIEKITLLEKKGGKSSYATSPPAGMKASVLVISDSIASGKKEDRAGLFAKEFLKKEGVKVKSYEIVPDEKELIQEKIYEFCDTKKVDLLLMTGGTGASPRDVTPEALLPLLDKRFTGIESALFTYGFARTPYAALSRTTAGIRKKTLILALPGSQRGVQESLKLLFPWIFHIYLPLSMKSHDEKKESKQRK